MISCARSSATIYIAMTIQTSITGASYVSAYLEVLTPGTTTHAQYVITFKASQRMQRLKTNLRQRPHRLHKRRQPPNKHPETRHTCTFI
jgi:hypothetical protein